jgi:adenosyl cobinamide kinase/adenosyl cobinamide phosphate guanylyltransferase
VLIIKRKENTTLANAKDIKPDALRILLVGEAGTGKTVFASTFPNAYFVDLDDGMLSVRGKDVNYISISQYETNDPDFDEIIKDLPKPKGGKRHQELSTFEKAQVVIEHWANNLKAGDTLVIDSLTFYSQAAFDYIIETEKPKDNRMAYGAAQKLISATLDLIRTRPCNIILIAHKKIKTDENGNVVEITPQTVGNALANILPSHFDEVWRMEVELKKKGGEDHKTYVMHTCPTRKEKGKSRLRLPDRIEEPSYEKIMSLIEN